MATPGKTVTKYLFVANATTGAGITGLTASAFTVTAWTQIYSGTPAVYAVTPTVTEMGSGYYAVAFALGAGAGYNGVDIAMVSTSYVVRPTMFGGETETYDLTALAALIPRGQTAANAVSGIGQAMPITIAPYRYWTLSWTITGLDLTQYSNFCLGIRDATQQAYKVNLWFSAAIFATWASTAQGNLTFTGTSSGQVTITLPQSLVGPVYVPWAASQPKKVGDCVVPTSSNGYVYCCTTAGTTSSSAPSWPTTPGTPVTDGTVTWTCLAKSIWQASTVYHYGDYVTPQSKGTPATGGIIMRCVSPGTSNSSEPTWPTVPSNPEGGSPGYVTDNGVTWQVFNDVYAMLGEGSSTVTGFFELTGQNATTGKMDSLTPSSPLTFTRREVGT